MPKGRAFRPTLEECLSDRETLQWLIDSYCYWDEAYECLLWGGAVFIKTSYGRYKAMGVKWYDHAMHIHRIFYINLKDDVRKSHDIHHICKNTLCVNIDHLVALTPMEHKAAERGEGLPPIDRPPPSPYDD